MVLGIRSKSKKSVSVQVHYIIHVQEIKPWPPSQSLRSAQSLVLQWENGDKNYGTFASSPRDGKIEINESFRLSALLTRESSKRGKHHDSFQKNCLDFYLYERQNDKTAKSQVLGSATINIADYGIIKETKAISTQVNCKKNSKNSAQPLLYISIQPFDIEGSDSSPKSSLSKEFSLDKEESESASQSLNDEDVEIASFTDDEIDDTSSTTSHTIISASETTEGNVKISKGTKELNEEFIVPAETTSGSHIKAKAGVSFPSSSMVLSSDTGDNTNYRSSSPIFPEDRVNVADASSKNPESASTYIKVDAGASKQLNGMKSHSSSTKLSSDTGSPAYDRPSSPKLPEERVKVADSSSKIPQSILISNRQSTNKGVMAKSLSSASYIPEEHVKFADAISRIPESIEQSKRQNISKGAMVKSISSASYVPEIMQSGMESSPQSQANQEGSMNHKNSRRGQRYNKDDPQKANNLSNIGILGDREKMENTGKGQEELVTMRRKLVENELVHNLLEDDSPKQEKLSSVSLHLRRRSREQHTNVLINDKPEDLTSPKMPIDTADRYGLFSKSQAHNQAEDNNTVNHDQVDAAYHGGTKINDNFNNSRTELNFEVQMLRKELREAAALEVSLYSVIAEHGSSASKVHASARRLSRFYFHAYRVESPAARASAAQSAVSGIVLVSKACGNDVPRLTFWLSNLILLRAMVSKGVEKIQLDNRNGLVEEHSPKRSPPLHDKEEDTAKYVHSWEDSQTFLFALEKIEAWIFSRIVESVWWQTLTPYMQSAATKSSSAKKVYGRKHSSVDQEQGNFSIDLWKRAFKDACERLCPLRAGGHACGCLPVIARLVMEQLVNRLDVAMFNAILRESDEEMPTDPMSDPISDTKVLPIPAGKSGFGAGAQLKNVIGNWSRWLSHLFDIDDGDSPNNRSEEDGNKNPEWETSFKAFHFLNSLSDLMMLPFEMLADGSLRKEVCPTIGVPLIRRVLNNFVPDEFCPGPVPEAVFETLNTEEDIQNDEASITNFPHIAAPTFYAAPPADSVIGIIQEMGTQTLLRSGSSVVKKSYTSDDELDDLDSPLSAIGIDEPSLASKFTAVTGGRNVVRYELLREVWRDSE